MTPAYAYRKFPGEPGTRERGFTFSAIGLPVWAFGPTLDKARERFGKAAYRDEQQGGA